MKQILFLFLLGLFAKEKPMSLPELPPSGGSAEMVNELPNYILPSPEAAAMYKAQQLSVNYSTGSPNVDIPLGSLKLQNYTLSIDLSYTSIGVKVDEYATMVGLGWNLNYGGVITRTVMDAPDDSRSATNNIFTAPAWNGTSFPMALLDFFKYAPDKQCDIFTVSLPGFSARFILDANLKPVFLNRNNYKIQVINNNFQNGFTVISDDGTQYAFAEKEISINRNPSGTNCSKSYDNMQIITSWYLSTITLPSTRKTISFSYTEASCEIESSSSQTISKVIATTTYPDGKPGFTMGEETFTNCIPRQTVKTKYINAINTSDGDNIAFTYDAVSRADLEGGKRLTTILFASYDNRKIRKVSFESSYENSVNTSSQYRSKRLFLNAVKVASPYGSNLLYTYSFGYINKSLLPARLSTGQDMYGFYNGKNSNASLLPKLSSTDINYSSYNNGNGANLILFGDRSINTGYAKYGLLNKVTYPTGGYDEIEYEPARKSATILVGGNCVSYITSYAVSGEKARQKKFEYKFYSSGQYSAELINYQPIFSQQTKVNRDGKANEYSIGPGGTYATVTSSPELPFSAFGTQHLYYKSVLEYEMNSETATNGITEHLYTYYNGLDLHPENLQPQYSNIIMGTPYHIVPDVTIGEHETNIYKGTATNNYTLQKKTSRILVIVDEGSYPNYSVKQRYMYGIVANPPQIGEFQALDIMRYYIYRFTVQTQSITETTYDEAGTAMSVTKDFEYHNPAYTYPTKITTTSSDNIASVVTKTYPPDYTAYNYMTSRNIISPVVQETESKGSNTLTVATYAYSDWFGDGKNLVPASLEVKTGNSDQIGKILFEGYDVNNNVQQLSKINDQKISYIWDYKGNYPVAKVSNAIAGSIAYCSFESDGKGNWVFGGSTLNDASSPTGEKCYSLTAAYPVSKTGLISSTKYIVSYWSKNGAYTISGSNVRTGKTIDGWTYYEHSFTGKTSVSISGTGLVDELRLYPATAMMQTFTYEPQIGMTAQCDENNRITYYTYDVFDRLNLIKDQDKNILKKFCYNYNTGTSQACANSIYFNDEKSQTFTRNNCGAGYTGGAVTYTVPANKYSSTVSVADANVQAQNDINANGQNYANQNGTCVAACNGSNCSGEGRKCVNGVCETGIKICKSSVQVHGQLWEITYYYRWSDGSISQDYTESSSMPCEM